MAFFQLMLKANKLEKTRLAYQDEKLRSIEISKGAKVHYTLSQKIRRRKIMLKRKFRSCWDKCTSCPENTWFHKKSVLLRTEGTFENFILKSVMGFLGGMFLTYMFFMFFVFQLNFTLSSATMLCSLFGIILTIGLAFSYRVRCVVFLLLPQFFSKRGRQALMAYAFILALTGPAKNMLHNTGVLSESLACGQEQLKDAVRSIVDLVKQPFYALRDAIAKVIKTVKIVVKKIKQALLAIKRMVLSILRVIKAAFQWLGSVINMCNKKLGTPYERCQRVFEGAVSDCRAKLGPILGTVCNLTHLAETLCYVVKPLDFICTLVSFAVDTIIGSVRKKIKKFAKHMKAMFYVKVQFSHSFHFETNKSRTLEEVSTGIVTEIRSRTDRFLTLFDWMSFVTSLFVLFMLLRVIHYRQKWLTNERFDNRYLTDDLRHIDMIRAKRDKETVLPLNPRERNKYIPLTSITLIRVERIKLMKSAVFLGLTTFKLCIHMIADYSLYWMLSTIRYHGRFETKVQRTNAVGVYVSGNGYLAELYRSIVRAFSPLGTEMEMDTVPCLPDPVPPDLDRYTQIISLIVFSWFMAIFEPYGLRLRQVVMAYYHPQRAQQRAVWLYNHIIRSRGSFLKYARRQLRRKFGMHDGKGREHVTFKERMLAVCPILRHIFEHDERVCLLCGTVEREKELPHVKCPTPGCIGLFCTQCFADLQNLCTICLAPMDYGDLSDMSEEKDSSDDQQPRVHGRVKKIAPRPRKVVELAEDEKKLIQETPQVGETEPTSPTEDSDVASSTEYSQSYQDEEPEQLDLTKDRRIHHKDVEAQKLHDDVTIQIFNEPLRGDATSGTESPTSCFVVRAHRRLRSRLERKYSSSSSSSSIADTESLSTTEVIEEDEVIHIEIEDDSDKGILGAGGSKILKKKEGRVEKIIHALSRVSWLGRKTEQDRGESRREIETRRPSLMNRVVDMLQTTKPQQPVRTYKHARKSRSDGEQYDECLCSSSSSESSLDDEYEKRALVRKHGKRSSRKKPRRCRDYSDDYIYETSWESHRQRGDTPRYVQCPKFDKNRYSQRINALSKGTMYREIDEINMNKLSSRKSSSDTTRTDKAWNITETEDKQDTTSSYSRSSRDNATEGSPYSVGMSTIEEDSKELSTTDNRTENEIVTSQNETDVYIDQTDFPSVDTDKPEKQVRRKQRPKYVTDDELRAAQERKQRKQTRTPRGEERTDVPDLYDPLAGLEIYGVYGKKKRKMKQLERNGASQDATWAKEETSEISEDQSDKSGEEVKIEDTSTEKQEELKKSDTGTEISETEVSAMEIPKSEKTERQEIPGSYREHRRCVKRSKKENCRKRRKRKDPGRERKYLEATESSTPQPTEVRKICGTQAKPQEWLYEEQRQLWEQMCAKMAEYSHRFGCPDKHCQPAPYFPHDGCTIPMYNPNLFRPSFSGQACPRFSCSERISSRGQKPIPPVLKRFLPKYQRPNLIDELKSHDRAKLIKERDERRRKCDCGQMTNFEKDQGSFKRNILSRPSIVPERTDVLPYQGTESFKDLVDEYRRIKIPEKIEETSGEDDPDVRDEEEPLISLSKNVDKSKDVKQLFPPEPKEKRPSVVAKIGNKLASVFKPNGWRKRAEIPTVSKIADSESWSEMSTVDRTVKTGGTTSGEDTTDNNQTTD